MKNKSGFTLIELLAVLAILALVLIIAIPIIMGIRANAKEAAFKSNALLIIHSMEIELARNNTFDPTTITADNIDSELGIDNSNYDSVTVTIESSLITVEIVGKEKWAGLVATGNINGITVSESTGVSQMLIASYSPSFNYSVILTSGGSVYINADSKKYVPFLLDYSSSNLADQVLAFEMYLSYPMLHVLLPTAPDYDADTLANKTNDIALLSYIAYTNPTDWYTNFASYIDAASTAFSNSTFVEDLESDAAYTAIRDEVQAGFDDWITSTTHVSQKITGISGVSKVFTNNDTIFFVMNDGSLKALGYTPGLGNSYFGAEFAPTITTVPGITNVTKIKYVLEDTYIFTSSGDVYGYGANTEYGPNLGGITEGYLTTPTLIPALNNATDIIGATQEQSKVALFADGTVKAWGYTQYGQVPITGQGTHLTTPTTIAGLTNVKSITPSYNGYYAIRNDGTLAVWGQNTSGQLGIGTTTNVTSGYVNTSLTSVKKVVADYGIAAALLTDGSIYVTGDNTYGLLGVATPTSITTFTQEFNTITATDIAAEDGFLILSDAGTLYGTGAVNYYLQEEPVSMLFALASGITNVTGIFFDDMPANRTSRLNYIVDNKTITSIGTSQLWHLE